MNQLKRFYALLIEFQQQFQQYKIQDVTIIEIDVGASHGACFKFDQKGQYLGCGLGA